MKHKRRACKRIENILTYQQSRKKSVKKKRQEIWTWLRRKSRQTGSGGEA
jgi:hypothetical protein